MIKKTFCAAALISSLVATSAFAAKWHMPTPYGDANLPTKIAHAFAKEINEGTAGDLDITVHSGASLIKHPEIPRAVKTGQVQMGEIFLGIMGNTHPVFKHDNIPFLASTYEDAEKLWTAAKPEVSKQLAKEGMKLLYVVAWPAQSLYTKAPVNTLADLKGLKMRAYSPSTSRVAVLMGTTPTTVQVPEIPQAFSTGIVEAMITSPSTGVNGQAWDYITDYTDVKAWIPKNVVVVNAKAFKRLDEKSQKVIMDAAANAEKKGWEGVRAQAKKDTQTLVDNGIKVVQPSADLLKELSKIGKVMVKEWQDESGAEIDTILTNYSK
ncbi:C4-dicarboxylate ABC transporter substrate-binding protein ['Osedax' symbiont bacterium Rs2_46_30_T18]|nr:C4-dicarboxylate ABC transporter substrate-binding protein ['Osedax' symbiont bacterium Rs2_46_30_T18]